MYFSIIIPTHNRALLLEKTLYNIKNLRYPLRKFEVIIVDNRSTDGTRTIIASFSKAYPHLHIRYVYEERQGRSFTSNTGFRIAKYPVTIFLDDDVLIKPELLITYKNVFQNYPNAFIVGGNITAVTAKTFRTMLNKIKKDDMWTMGQVDYGTKRRDLLYPESLFSGCLAIRTTKADQAKGVFDETLGVQYKNAYLYGEDYELCLRSKLEGKQIIYEPKLSSQNVVEKNRLNRPYILKRYFLAGVERYIIDTKLQKRFPLHKVYSFQLIDAVKNFFKAIVLPHDTSGNRPEDLCFAIGYYVFGKAYLNRTLLSFIFGIL